MKHLVFMCAFVATLLVSVASCNNKPVDPIHDVSPVDTTWAEGFPLESFHEFGLMGDTATQAAMVEAHRATLTRNVIQHYPEAADSTISFEFGSGHVSKVLSGDGKTYDGEFKNELIIIIANVDTVFLACGNGLLGEITWSENKDLGSVTPHRFTILQGEGLAHHLTSLQMWADAADKLGIPIKDKEGNIVTKETYAEVLGSYESYLFPGDVIDLALGKIWNEKGQEVDFSRRQQEADKAKAKKANSQKNGKKK